MKTLKQIATLLLITIITVNCSSIYGGTTSSSGDQSISNDLSEISFTADVGTTNYRSLSFTNRSDDVYEINNMAFVDNVCGSYSLHSVEDSSGNVLYSGREVLSVTVASEETVYLQIQFSPTPCETTNYITNLLVYYLIDDTQQARSISLVTEVTDNTPPSLACEDTSLTYHDEFTNPTIRTLPALPDGQNYYLKIIKMNAYIQTTGGFVGFATQVGTHLNLDLIPDEDEYQPVYIPFTTDVDGNLTVESFDECFNFTLPAPVTDPFFLGASVGVTMAQNYSGTINRTDEPGAFQVDDVQFKLHSFINNSNSLLQSEDGYFDVDTVLTLTTGTTEENTYLADLTDLVDDDGDIILNIVDNRLQGKSVRHGTVTLVGIGAFVETEETKASNEGFQALLKNESYIFLQIEALITQEVIE